MEYNVISADSHIDMTWMPGNLFADNAPADLADIAPKVVETDDGPKWFAEGVELGVAGGLGFSFTPPKRGVAKQLDRMWDAGFYEGGPHPTTPELRLKDMEMDGIDAEVIYGILTVGLIFKNTKLTQFIFETYNDWAAGFKNSNPGRWAPLACVPNHDAQVAATELRRAAGLGLKGADFAVAAAGKPIWHSDWNVFWQAAAECDMPISFHSTGWPGYSVTPEGIPEENMTMYFANLATLFQVAGADFLANVIHAGVCDRFPDFKFVLGECGVGWVPFILGRMDEEWEDQYSRLGYSLTPSEFWHRQGYTTFQHERDIPAMLPLVGEDNVLWGSDYPHGDGVWPDSKATLDRDLAGVSAEVRRKLTRDNAGKLYKFLD